jgi:hypothetical protein
MKDDRGDNDLEVVIDKLTKQKEFLQFQCRKAGNTIEGYKSRGPWSGYRETFPWFTNHGA